MALHKEDIVASLQRRLQEDLDRTRASQKATQAGATHAESKAENDKDTRAIESTYLARGLAERVVALESDLTRLEALPLRTFDEDDPIGLSACVVLEGAEDGGGDDTYFLAPVGGGVKLDVQGQLVVVVTPRSPVGMALVGKVLDDDVRVATPRGFRETCVLEVS